MKYLIWNDETLPADRIEAETPWEALQLFFANHPKEIHDPVTVMEGE
jgi:hypothetical protein